MVALILVLACGRPPGMAGCDTIADGVEREECRFVEAKKLVKDPDALAAATATLDPATRDLLFIRLAMDSPMQTSALCGKVTTPVAQQRCQQILGRPHLRGDQR